MLGVIVVLADFSSWLQCGADGTFTIYCSGMMDELVGSVVKHVQFYFLNSILYSHNMFYSLETHRVNGFSSRKSLNNLIEMIAEFFYCVIFYCVYEIGLRMEVGFSSDLHE